jgi:periplasmic divalent cation tolerance protein
MPRNGWLCVIKSKGTLYEELEKAVRAAHPYKEPEIVATPIIKGSSGYLAWLDKSTR